MLKGQEEGNRNRYGRLVGKYWQTGNEEEKIGKEVMRRKSGNEVIMSGKRGNVGMSGKRDNEVSRCMDEEIDWTRVHGLVEVKSQEEEEEDWVEDEVLG
ncbi:hypothetical protein Pmani_018054 [Petrolisthes manimaculis]|uniref:Uncharacterized protein n=1 Tax=Petrolisthes manimaculis TaxID=1843537 RepID=A0AAE1PNI1_9EUCA|nr:hypothetical protein Pmani_018054 [Petrolisthes manimaculis]